MLRSTRAVQQPFGSAVTVTGMRGPSAAWSSSARSSRSPSRQPCTRRPAGAGTRRGRAVVLAELQHGGVDRHLLRTPVQPRDRERHRAPDRRTRHEHRRDPARAPVPGPPPARRLVAAPGGRAVSGEHQGARSGGRGRLVDHDMILRLSACRGAGPSVTSPAAASRHSRRGRCARAKAEATDANYRHFRYANRVDRLGGLGVAERRCIGLSVPRGSNGLTLDSSPTTIRSSGRLGRASTASRECRTRSTWFATRKSSTDHEDTTKTQRAPARSTQIYRQTLLRPGNVR